MSFREYEIRNKPLFASMKWANKALSKEHAAACDIKEFFDYLERRYGKDTLYIQYVTFYDYTFHEKNKRYHIAYIYTAPSLKIRDLIFDERDEITIDTGWYPMVSGARANFTKIKNSNSNKYWDEINHKPPHVQLGKPMSIRNAACDISSTALLLKCENGSILLDTGFEVEKDIIEEINFIVISHFHRDHTGGLYGFLSQREVPVILSGITLKYLLNLKSVKSTDKERLIKNAVLIERLCKSSHIKETLEFFNSYHCPGAYGLKYKYEQSCFTYPGDFCLINGFYDFSDNFYSLINDPDNKDTSIVTDCALVPKHDFSITDKDFEKIAENILSNDRNQIFVSKGVELLFNIYIRLFRMAVDEHKDWLFIVNDDLFYLLQNVLRTWILPVYKGDLFVEHVIGKSGMNYAETQRLYTMSSVEQFSNYCSKRLMLLLSLEDLNALNCSIDTCDMDIHLTGPLALAKNINEIIGEFSFNSIDKLSSPDWSFHSDREAIKQIISSSRNPQNRFILFHAYPKDIKKFIREFAPDLQNKLSYVSKNEVML